MCRVFYAVLQVGVNGFGQIVILECYLVGAECYLMIRLQKGMAGGSKYLAEINRAQLPTNDLQVARNPSLQLLAPKPDPRSF